MCQKGFEYGFSLAFKASYIILLVYNIHMHLKSKSSQHNTVKPQNNGTVTITI